MKISVTRKVALGFAAALAILGVISLTSYVTTQELVKSMEAVAQTYRVLAELRDISHASKDIQASSRGYIISGQDTFLEPYQDAVKGIDDEIREVRNLTVNKPRQGRRLGEIEELVKQQLEFTRQTIDLRRSRGFEAAELRVSSGQGQQIVNRIRELVDEMTTQEEQLLQERRDLAAANVLWVNWVLLIGGVLTLGIVAAANIVLHYDIVQREHLERAILEVSDREQQRFGRDLHDSLCQELAGIAFMSQVAERSLTASAPAQAAEVGRIAALVGQAVSHARGLARGLQPVEVESNGLMVALDELARTVREMFHVKCELACDSPVLVGDNAVAVHLYRIAQEAVHNAIRHGQCKNIAIRLRHDGHNGHLEVQDDGKGIPRELPKSRGMGLETMHYRATMIGAGLSVRRGANGGSP